MLERWPPSRASDRTRSFRARRIFCGLSQLNLKKYDDASRPQSAGRCGADRERAEQSRVVQLRPVQHCKPDSPTFYFNKAAEADAKTPIISSTSGYAYLL